MNINDFIDSEKWWSVDNDFISFNYINNRHNSSLVRIKMFIEEQKVYQDSISTAYDGYLSVVSKNIALQARFDENEECIVKLKKENKELIDLYYKTEDAKHECSCALNDAEKRIEELESQIIKMQESCKSCPSGSQAKHITELENVLKNVLKNVLNSYNKGISEAEKIGQEIDELFEKYE